MVSAEGVAAPLSAGGFSPLDLRFFADFDSTGTLAAVDILTEA